MQGRTRLIITGGVLASVVFIGIAYSALVIQNAPSGRTRVAASFYPYYYFASRVGGDRVTVASLVPVGMEPHDWEPSPKDLQTIYNSQVFVFNGFLEPYTTRVLQELPANHPLQVNASVGLAIQRTENGEVDPHAWLNPQMVKPIADRIADALSQIDPSGASYYKANAQLLKSDLDTTDAQYSSGLKQCNLRTIVTAHEAFRYVSNRYNITQVAIAGLSPNEEPSPEKLREILSIVNSTGVTYIFYEELVDPRVAQTLAQEAKVHAAVLNPIEGLTPDEERKGDNYLTVMEQNLLALRLALSCT